MLWNSRQDCPRHGRLDGPICEIVVFEPWDEALKGIECYPQLEVLNWFHRARRDLVLQSAHRLLTPRGTFSLRSPMRPNPIGSSVVKLVSREARRLVVRGLDCMNGTPLIDIKPERKLFGFSPAPVT